MAIVMNLVSVAKERTNAKTMSRESLEGKAAPKPESKEEPHQAEGFQSSLALLSSIAMMMSDKERDKDKDKDKDSERETESGGTRNRTHITLPAPSIATSTSNESIHGNSTTGGRLKRKWGGLTRSLTRTNLRCEALDEAMLQSEPRPVRRAWQSKSTPSILSMASPSPSPSPSSAPKMEPKQQQKAAFTSSAPQLLPRQSRAFRSATTRTTTTTTTTALLAETFTPAVATARRRSVSIASSSAVSETKSVAAAAKATAPASSSSSIELHNVHNVYRSYEMILPHSVSAGHILLPTYRSNFNAPVTTRIDDYNYEIPDCNPLKDPPRLPNPSESFSIAERSIEERNTWGWYA